MKFGFRVEREMVWDPVTYTHTDVPTGKWTVSLPHQCDRWVVVGEGYAEGVDHSSAIVNLTKFINEAQIALRHLRAEEEFGNE